MKFIKTMYKCIVAVLLIWFGALSVLGYPFGYLGLGIILVVGAVWWSVKGPAIWADYQKYYKKLPKSKHTIWNKPSQGIYYFSLFVFIPFAAAVGALLIYVAWIVR